MIKAFKGTSLVDFPNEIAFTIFTGGCNLRCPYCYNKALVDPVLLKNLEDIDLETVIVEIQRRKGFITGCVITGGEPTIHREKLLELLKHIKKENLKVKLDTNGMNTQVLSDCVKENLVDYVAIDVKTSPDKYQILKGSWENLVESLKVVKDSKIEHEVRITAVPKFIQEEDLEAIGSKLQPLKRVAIQKFIGKNTLDPSFESVSPYDPEKLKKFANIMEKYSEEVLIR